MTRLVDQKGVDILLDAVRFLEGMRRPTRRPGKRVGRPGRRLCEGRPTPTPTTCGSSTVTTTAWPIGCSPGATCIVMPSRFEPCGLGQMQAMAYGSIPVVTDVGGLHDTVIDADAHRRTGTGFVSRRGRRTGHGRRPPPGHQSAPAQGPPRRDPAPGYDRSTGRGPSRPDAEVRRPARPLTITRSTTS